MKKSAKERPSTKKSSLSPHYVNLHPHSFKYLKKGHPWILQDQYTNRFPAKEPFIYAKGQGQAYTFLNDPKHTKVKARLWHVGELSPDQFQESLAQRLKQAFLSRQKVDNRDNYYLLFGEADFVPGLFIQWLKEGILIQSYSSFWKKQQKSLVPLIREQLAHKNLKWVLWQDRDNKRENNFKPLWGKVPNSIVINEYDVNYQLYFDQTYDIGIYTDMSSLREKLKGQLSGKKVLNLYSYTGAWSLFPLQQGAQSAISVDLSEKYLHWLEENLKINPRLEPERHRSMQMDCEKALRKLLSEDKKFDLIICDPPSFSSDGQKTSSSYQVYKKLLPLFSQLLENGGQAHCFINTHNITRRKYKEYMKQEATKNSLKTSDELYLDSDCPRLENFPEGDYLKGIILYKRENK